MKKEKIGRIARGCFGVCAVLAAVAGIFRETLPQESARVVLPVLCVCMLLSAVVWERCLSRRLSDFSNDICETVNALMEGREPENFHPYEESEISRAQGKLLQYYEKMKDGQRQSEEDRQVLQELVSDISHQVKTPTANIVMFAEILRSHSLTEEKRGEFLGMMEVQIEKLNFLMESLIKISRLETGTFVLQVKENSLYQTIAGAVEGVWAKAEKKSIRLEVDCDSRTVVKHDPKWTAEAIGNILDNAVKYTPEGGQIQIDVRPWQFYTRIDISDTGIGIAEEHYHDVFRRFYRAPEAAAQEGIGLGLYLARGIINRQKGYISVKSKIGEGTAFSVYLLN